jgi:hypothetical protein
MLAEHPQDLGSSAFTGREGRGKIKSRIAIKSRRVGKPESTRSSSILSVAAILEPKWKISKGDFSCDGPSKPTIWIDTSN